MKPKSSVRNSLIAAALFSAINLSAGESFSLKQVADGFVSPTTVVSLPGSPGTLVVADQVGVVYLVADGSRQSNPFLDLRPKLAKINQAFDERGLLGLALHPDYAKNKKLYVCYSAPGRAGLPAEWDHTMHISEFKAGDRGVDLATEKVLLQIDKPYFNHSGGCIQFGPDGFLYIAVGDGGNGNGEGRGHSPISNGQDKTVLLGKILRIDVNGGEPYNVPKDNPFVGKEGRPEIFAYGFRNPWRISFDRGGKRELFAADVGQDMYEEVNSVVKGGNYGWFIREGFHCFDPKNPRKAPADCAKVGADGEPLLDPAFEYKSFRGFPKDTEALGISITGGYVYRGKALPQLAGKYVFADWSRHWVKGDGVVYIAAPGTDGKNWKIEAGKLASHEKGVGAYITAFGEDSEGELYLTTNDSNALVGTTGKVWKLVP